MKEKIKVQIKFDGDYNNWEDIKPMVLKEVDFDIEKNGNIYDMLADYLCVYNAFHDKKIQEIRWQWGDIGQGHYVGFWNFRKIL